MNTDPLQHGPSRREDGPALPAITPPERAESEPTRTRVDATAKTDPAGILDTVSVPCGSGRVFFGDLKKASTLAAVRELYAEKGVEFVDDHALMTRLKKDWGTLRESVLPTASNLPHPETYPVRIVEGHGVPIRIIGVLHVYKAEAETHRLLTDVLRQCPSLITEQNLGRSNFGLHSHGVELPDQAVDGIWRHALDLHNKAWRTFPKTFLSSIPRLSWFKGSPSDSDLAPDVRAARWLKGDTGIDFAPLARASLWTRGDEWVKVPTAVDLEYRELYGIRYSQSQRRSAYMAEMMRLWDPAKTFAELPSDTPKDVLDAVLDQKPFLCGLAHAPEMEYFLDHGCKDPQIVKRASAHADLLNQPHGLIKLQAHAAKICFASNALSTAALMLESGAIGLVLMKSVLWALSS